MGKKEQLLEYCCNLSPSAQEQILALAKYFKLPNTENKFLPQTPLAENFGVLERIL